MFIIFDRLAGTWRGGSRKTCAGVEFGRGISLVGDIVGGGWFIPTNWLGGGRTDFSGSTVSLRSRLAGSNSCFGTR